MSPARLVRRAVAPVVAALGGCGSPAPSGPCTEKFDIIVAASDYVSSQVGGVALDGRTRLRGSVDLGADPALSLSAGRAFLLARDTGTVFELDPRCGAGIARMSANDAASRPSNPQDVAVGPDGSLFVTRFGTPSVLVLPERRAIDLSSLDDDGNPDMSGAVAVGDRIFVALGRLDGSARFRSTRPSMVAVIDARGRALERTVTLAGRNPFGPLALDNGAIWLAEPGNFDSVAESDAGLERLDARALVTELVVREPALGGSAVEVAAHGSCAVVIVADATAKNRTSAVAVDLDRKRVVQRVFASDDFWLRGLLLDETRLMIGDRAPSGMALHVFRRSGCSFERERDVSLPAPPVGFRRPAPG